MQQNTVPDLDQLYLTCPTLVLFYSQKVCVNKII